MLMFVIPPPPSQGVSSIKDCHNNGRFILLLHNNFPRLVSKSPLQSHFCPEIKIFGNQQQFSTDSFPNPKILSLSRDKNLLKKLKGNQINSWQKTQLHMSDQQSTIYYFRISNSDATICGEPSPPLCNISELYWMHKEAEDE